MNECIVNYKEFPKCLSINTNIETILSNLDNTIGLGIDDNKNIINKNIIINTEINLVNNNERLVFYDWLDNVEDWFYLDIPIYGIMTKVRVSLLNNSLVESYKSSQFSNIPLKMRLLDDINLEELVCNKLVC